MGKAGADQLTGERSSAGHQPVLGREPAGGLAVSPRTRANRTTARRRRASTRPTPAPQGRATNQDPPQRHPMQRHPMQWRAPAPPAVAMLQPEGGSGSRPSRCSPGWEQLQRRRLWMEEPRPWTPGAGKGLQEILRACQCKPMHNPHKRLTPRGFRAPAWLTSPRQAIDRRTTCSHHLLIQTAFRLQSNRGGSRHWYSAEPHRPGAGCAAIRTKHGNQWS